MSPFSAFSENAVMLRQHILSSKFLIVWNIASAMSLLLPILIFTIARMRNNGDENQDDNQDQEQENYYDEYGNYVGPTHWWQFWKSSNNNYDNDGQQEDDREAGVPWWYLWGQQEREPEEEGRGTLVFIYVWTLLTFAFVTYWVHKLSIQKNMDALRWALFGFANYGFICCVLLGGLEAVQVEGREIEETGWYGQTSVLVFLTCLFNMLSSLFLALWTFRKSAKPAPLVSEDESTDYRPADEQTSGAVV